LQSFLLSFGACYAASLEQQKETKMHNAVPFITCEGKCGEHRETFTTHRLESEEFDQDKEEYVQRYTCTICKTGRKFGATTGRVTRGESN
jgi:hypothetical protein